MRDHDIERQDEDYWKEIDKRDYIECPADIFKQFEDASGGLIDLSDEAKTFAYEATQGSPLDISWDPENNFVVVIGSNHKKLALVYEDPEAWERWCAKNWAKPLGPACKIRVFKYDDDVGFVI